MSLSNLSSRSIIGSFFARLEQSEAQWIDLLTRTFTSNQASEEYRWLGQVPPMREWEDGRLVKGLRDFTLTIRNRAFESTLEIDADDLRRDKSDQIITRIEELADRAGAHWGKLLVELIEGGESATCYDGSAYFSNDHQEGLSGSQSNSITVDLMNLPLAIHGTPTRPTSAELASAIFSGMQQIVGVLDDQGEPMNENAQRFAVMAPVSLMGPLLGASNASTDENGSTALLSVARGAGVHVVPIITPRLSWTDQIAVFRVDGEGRPFIRQDEVPVEFTALAEGSAHEFTHRKHLYGCYASGNVGYGYWQQACLVKMV